MNRTLKIAITAGIIGFLSSIIVEIAKLSTPTLPVRDSVLIGALVFVLGVLAMSSINLIENRKKIERHQNDDIE